MSPLFIALDGIDGTGKSTQVDRLAAYLREHNVRTATTKEPGGTQAGTAIRSILLDTNMILEPDTEILLFCADRVEHQQKVLSILEMGTSVISDRFLSSTWAYQIFGRKERSDLLEAILPHTITRYPDLTIILDMEPTVAVERAKARLMQEGKTLTEGRFEAEEIEFFTEVRKGFHWYAGEERFGRSVIVDATGDIDEVSAKIQEIVNELNWSH
ncbi:MAG: dTMP kinase [Deferribacteraceae bacterium]|jgi:dTMP kinase|nr:dTMP kinase [Deferribacteraceae bacterium]